MVTATSVRDTELPAETTMPSTSKKQFLSHHGHGVRCGPQAGSCPTFHQPRQCLAAQAPWPSHEQSNQPTAVIIPVLEVSTTTFINCVRHPDRKTSWGLPRRGRTDPDSTPPGSRSTPGTTRTASLNTNAVDEPAARAPASGAVTIPNSGCHPSRNGLRALLSAGHTASIAGCRPRRLLVGERLPATRCATHGVRQVARGSSS